MVSSTLSPSLSARFTRPSLRSVVAAASVTAPAATKSSQPPQLRSNQQNRRDDEDTMNTPRCLRERGPGVSVHRLDFGWIYGGDGVRGVQGVMGYIFIHSYMEGSELPVRSNPDLVLLQGVAVSLG